MGFSDRCHYSQQARGGLGSCVEACMGLEVLMPLTGGVGKTGFSGMLEAEG